MKTGFWLGLVAAATFTVAVHAQAPSGATGECKDGTFTQAASRSGACSSHGGVKTWYPSAGGAQKAPANGTLNPAKPQPDTTGVEQKRPPRPGRDYPVAPVDGSGYAGPQAPGGNGPGLVWVDSKSNKAYCSADPNYGRTKTGMYLSFADAKAKGVPLAPKQNCSYK